MTATIRYHQHHAVAHLDRAAFDRSFREGCDTWVEGQGSGSVAVDGEWLVDKEGQRRFFKTAAGANRAARQHLRDKAEAEGIPMRNMRDFDRL
jgi:hypothetical protein